MKTTPVSAYKDPKLKSQLDNIPFIYDLATNAWDQHDLLMQHSSIIELSPGDILIEKGNTDKIFYFLLKGELAVYKTKEIDKKSEPITRLGAGQVLGALTIMTSLPRTATVAVERKGSDALVFATDFSMFGELNDFSKITLETKLTFFRIVINNTRFKLDSYKKKAPNHPFANIYADLPRFSGERGSMEELQCYFDQAPTLTRLLSQWNEKQ